MKKELAWTNIEEARDSVKKLSAEGAKLYERHAAFIDQPHYAEDGEEVALELVRATSATLLQQKVVGGEFSRTALLSLTTAMGYRIQEQREAEATFISILLRLALDDARCLGVRCGAIDGLGIAGVGTSEIRDGLSMLLQSPEPAIRQCAQGALEDLYGGTTTQA